METITNHDVLLINRSLKKTFVPCPYSMPIINVKINAFVLYASPFRAMASLFRNGCDEKINLGIKYQYLHFKLAYDITCTCCGFTNVFRNLCDRVLKFKWMLLAPFRKWNSFNNFRKDVKFGTYWVLSLLNTLPALYNIFHNGLIHTTLNNTWALLGMVMFSCECK